MSEGRADSGSPTPPPPPTELSVTGGLERPAGLFPGNDLITRVTWGYCLPRHDPLTGMGANDDFVGGMSLQQEMYRMIGDNLIDNYVRFLDCNSISVIVLVWRNWPE